MRDFVLWVNEGLFWLLDGKMLIDTPWIFLWITIGTVIAALPVLLMLHRIINITFVRVVLSVVWFILTLFVVISPGAIQTQMMSECRESTANLKIYVDDELSETNENVIEQCRYKDNYYGDFGDWEVKGIDHGTNP
jgi:predicted membrane protein